MIAKCWYRVVAAAMMISQAAVVACAQEVPFEGEFLLDARPMPGSKRIPNIEFSTNGTIVLEMWCNRVEGQVVIAGDTITVITGQPTDRGCSPERARADTELLDTLSAVTNWRRQGDSVMLIGPKTLRFKVMTN